MFELAQRHSPRGRADSTRRSAIAGQNIPLATRCGVKVRACWCRSAGTWFADCALVGPHPRRQGPTLMVAQCVVGVTAFGVTCKAVRALDGKDHHRREMTLQPLEIACVGRVDDASTS